MDIKSLINGIPWEEGASIRVLWLKADGVSRTQLAEEIKSDEEHAILPVILRSALFISSNALMADLAKLISQHEDAFQALKEIQFTKLTIVIVSNDRLSLPQASSPVCLPQWFPILGGREVIVRISDVFDTAELEPLNGESSRIEQLASSLFDIESALVSRLEAMVKLDDRAIRSLIDTLNKDEPAASVPTALAMYKLHLSDVKVPRAYRPGAKSKKSLLSKLIYQVIKSSPDGAAAFSKKLACALGYSQSIQIKPSLFAVMLRPSVSLTVAETNCHFGILAFYQAYQLMNAAAHAGEYPSYPASLVLANAKDLARFLSDFLKVIRDSGAAIASDKAQELTC
jgi:hypothetical protein